MTILKEGVQEPVRGSSPIEEQIKVRPWYSGISRKGRLRTKFLLSLLLVSASLTCSTLLVVRHRVQSQTREEIREDLQSSVVTFQRFQRQRETALEGSAALLANLPIIEALMTSRDAATIQDASAGLWRKISVGGDLFVLANRRGKLMALNTLNPGFTRAQAEEMLQRSLRSGETRDWWFGGGHLFQVFMRPIYFGAPANDTELGILVLGSEINEQVAEEVRQVASSQVAFRYGSTVVVSTLSGAQNEELSKLTLEPPTPTSDVRSTSSGLDVAPVDVVLGQERFLAMSMDVPPSSSLRASLVVLRSYDQVTLFLRSLNRWLFGLGLTAILAGSLLVFLISDTFTRPLANLVGGVHALEKGNFDYPLEAQGNDEVAELTQSFVMMRHTLRRAQQELLQAERLATIGLMASTVSHDLRHSLTTILAYAEFLSEGKLTEPRRLEFYDEIRQAVNQMTDQLQALLEFSRARTINRPVRANIAPVIERAVHTVKARPAFRGIQVLTSFEGGSEGWFDPASLERVFHNLLLNACEAAPPESGRVEVTTQQVPAGLEIRVADNGHGIPAEVRGKLFQPFVTSGKDNGIGLGLATVHKIVQEHQGQVNVERTGTDGTVLRILLPETAAEIQVAR
jgi:signal transduction histidine kinase